MNPNESCPFCGAESSDISVETLVSGLLSADGYNPYNAVCTLCGAKGPDAQNADAAYSLWNER